MIAYPLVGIIRLTQLALVATGFVLLLPLHLLWMIAYDLSKWMHRRRRRMRTLGRLERLELAVSTLAPYGPEYVPPTFHPCGVVTMRGRQRIAHHRYKCPCKGSEPPPPQT